MKKSLISVIIIISIFFSINVNAKKEETKTPSAKSPHAILVDMKTGSILYQKNANDEIYPASITKIMTAVLAIENGNLEEVVEANETALANVGDGDSKMGIVRGERLSVRQLLYGMLLGSAADAANVLAEHVGGSIEEFVEMMNKKAKELEMTGTNFTNPVGNHDERHYSTTKDMALLSRYAMQIDEFKDIVKCDSYVIPATEKYSSERKIINRNHFVSRLLRGDYYYKYATGIKTGYTQKAKSCIAASASKDGMELLALVFEAENKNDMAMSFVDCKNMFDCVFENYGTQIIVKDQEIVAQTNIENTRKTKKIVLKTANEVSVLKNKSAKEQKITFKDNIPKSVKAPIKAGNTVGTREYFVNGNSVGIVSLVADADYKFDPITFIVNKMIAFVTSPWLFVVIGVIIIVLIFLERRRRRMLRRKRREARAKRNKELMEKLDMYN